MDRQRRVLQQRIERVALAPAASASRSSGLEANTV